VFCPVKLRFNELLIFKEFGLRMASAAQVTNIAVSIAVMSRQTHYRSIGDGFLRVKNPTNSVKALKENRVLRIRLHPTTSTPPCYNNDKYAV